MTSCVFAHLPTCHLAHFALHHFPVLLSAYLLVWLDSLSISPLQPLITPCHLGPCLVDKLCAYPLAHMSSCPLYTSPFPCTLVFLPAGMVEHLTHFPTPLITPYHLGACLFDKFLPSCPRAILPTLHFTISLWHCLLACWYG